mgnify:CR=1 FL=1
MKGEPMNSINLENEKLPVDKGESIEESANILPEDTKSENLAENNLPEEKSEESVSEQIEEVAIDYHLEDVEENEEVVGIGWQHNI